MSETQFKKFDISSITHHFLKIYFSARRPFFQAILTIIYVKNFALSNGTKFLDSILHMNEDTAV